MSWLQIITPLIAVILAYLGGYIAGKKAAELKQIKKEQGESDKTDQIISNNSNLPLNSLNAWIKQQANKK